MDANHRPKWLLLSILMHILLPLTINQAPLPFIVICNPLIFCDINLHHTAARVHSGTEPGTASEGMDIAAYRPSLKHYRCARIIEALLLISTSLTQ